MERFWRLCVTLTMHCLSFKGVCLTTASDLYPSLPIVELLHVPGFFLQTTEAASEVEQESPVVYGQSIRLDSRPVHLTLLISTSALSHFLLPYEDLNVAASAPLQYKFLPIQYRVQLFSFSCTNVWGFFNNVRCGFNGWWQRNASAVNLIPLT